MSDNTKHYLYPVAKSGFIDARGNRHVFEPYGHIGRLSTNNPELQKQLDDTIAKGGSHIRLEGSTESTPSLVAPTAAEVAKEALAAVNQQQLVETAEERTARIRQRLLDGAKNLAAEQEAANAAAIAQQ